MKDDDELATLKERQDAIQSIMEEEDLFEQLFKYGIYRLKMKLNVRYDLQRGFRGLMMEDLISELLQSFVTNDGGRNWNKTKFPDFKKQLLSAFDSHLCNTVNKELEKTIATVGEENIMDAPDNGHYDKLINVCLETLENHGASYEELQLFEPYYIHGMKRNDIAVLLKISVEEVTKAKTKLTQKLPLLRNALNNSEL